MDLLKAGLRQALFRDGARMIENLLNDPLYQGTAPQVLPGEKCYHGRGKTVETLFGEIYLLRDYRVQGWREPGALGPKPWAHRRLLSGTGQNDGPHGATCLPSDEFLLDGQRYRRFAP